MFPQEYPPPPSCSITPERWHRNIAFLLERGSQGGIANCAYDCTFGMQTLCQQRTEPTNALQRNSACDLLRKVEPRPPSPPATLWGEWHDLVHNWLATGDMKHVSRLCIPASFIDALPPKAIWQRRY